MKVVCANNTIVGAPFSKTLYFECWKYKMHEITSKTPTIVAMTQKKNIFAGLIPSPPDRTKTPIRTAKITSMAPQKSEITNLPITRPNRATSMPMKTGRIRLA